MPRRVMINSTGRPLFQDPGGILFKLPECGDLPSMVISVIADDEDLPVTWCGRTWIKSTETRLSGQLYSGEKAKVCPSVYRKEKVTKTLTTSYQYQTAVHLWGISGLNMGRYYWTYYSGTKRADNGLVVFPQGAYPITLWDLVYHMAYPPGTAWSAMVQHSGMNKVVYEPRPTRNSYELTSAFFGTATDANGVQFTWQQGDGW